MGCVFKPQGLPTSIAYCLDLSYHISFSSTMSLAFALSLVSLVFATPINLHHARALPRGDVTCGSNIYTVNEVVAAVNAGVDHLDNPIGDSKHFDEIVLPCQT